MTRSNIVLHNPPPFHPIDQSFNLIFNFIIQQTFRMIYEPFDFNGAASELAGCMLISNIDYRGIGRDPTRERVYEAFPPVVAAFLLTKELNYQFSHQRRLQAFLSALVSSRNRLSSVLVRTGCQNDLLSLRSYFSIIHMGDFVGVKILYHIMREPT